MPKRGPNGEKIEYCGSYTLNKYCPEWRKCWPQRLIDAVHPNCSLPDWTDEPWVDVYVRIKAEVWEAMDARIGELEHDNKKLLAHIESLDEMVGIYKESFERCAKLEREVERLWSQLSTAEAVEEWPEVEASWFKDGYLPIWWCVREVPETPVLTEDQAESYARLINWAREVGKLDGDIPISWIRKIMKGE